MEKLCPQLLDWIEDALEKQFTTNAPEMLVVKGLLFTLGRLLVLEPDRYAKFPDKRVKIYSSVPAVLYTTVVTLITGTVAADLRSLCPSFWLTDYCRYLSTVLATTVNGQMARYQVTKATLQFVAHNCELFRAEIGSNAYLWFTYVQYCCTSENKTVWWHSS